MPESLTLQEISFSCSLHFNSRSINIHWELLDEVVTCPSRLTNKQAKNLL